MEIGIQEAILYFTVLYRIFGIETSKKLGTLGAASEMRAYEQFCECARTQVGRGASIMCTHIGAPTIKNKPLVSPPVS